jgi:signal transduction histidine kinase
MKNTTSQEIKKETEFQFRRRQTFLLLTVGLIGASVLAGWCLNINFLKRPIPGSAAMNPITALCFMLSVCSLFLLRTPNEIKRKQNIGAGIASVILVIALIKLLSLVFGIETYIDYFLFQDRLKADLEINFINNRMAPNTAVAFLFTALALLFIQVKTSKQVPSQYLSMLVGIIGMLSVLGYIYRVNFFDGFLLYIPMSIHTGICFLFLAAAIFFMHPNNGIMAEFIGNKAGAISARILIPSAIIVPVLLGFLRLYGEWTHTLPFEFGTALLIMSITVVFLILIWFIIRELNKKDALQEEVEEQLRNTNKELEAFSYSVSHDLRAPLRAVHGYAQIMREDYESILDEEGKRILEAIKSNAKKMGALIDDLLAFSRLGRKEIQETKIDMNQLVDEVVIGINNSITHHAKIYVASLHSIRGDNVLLYQVVFNLVSNAIKYSSKKSEPEIKISSEKKEGALVFSVSDNGAGFEMAYADKLFGVFQRLHTQNEFEGTGVGLAIVHRIIEKHGGKVWAEGNVGEGAAFFFMLPENE